MPTFAPVFKTPGGVVRWIIRDMRTNAKVWQVDFFDAVCSTATGLVVRVCGEEGTVLVEQGDKRFMLCPGPFRRWRLKNAVRRLAAAQIAKVLP